MRRSTGSREGNAWEVVHPHAAGIDIGSREHYVAVGSDADVRSVRAFGVATADLFEMGRWLKACGVTTVAMESTGVYWVPVARILEEDFGIAVVLVDPRYVRSVPGRKSDVKDCQWLQRLHTYGVC
jgi:transposase